MKEAINMRNASYEIHLFYGVLMDHVSNLIIFTFLFKNYKSFILFKCREKCMRFKILST